MMFLAFALGVWLATVRGRKAGIESQFIMDMTVWLMIGGLAGARLTYVLFHMDEFRGHWIDAISPIQTDGTIGIAGLVVLGGVASGILTAWLFLRKKKLPFLKVVDVLIPSLVLGIAIGRVGCYLNGCCFGHPTHLPWAVIFPPESYAGSVYPWIAIHPTQLYEVIYNLIIMVFLLIRTSSKKFDGELLYWFLIFYGIFRFFNETIRYYQSSMILFNLDSTAFTFSMFLSLCMVIVGIILLVKGFKVIGKVK